MDFRQNKLYFKIDDRSYRLGRSNLFQHMRHTSSHQKLANQVRERPFFGVSNTLGPGRDFDVDLRFAERPPSPDIQLCFQSASVGSYLFLQMAETLAGASGGP